MPPITGAVQTYGGSDIAEFITRKKGVSVFPGHGCINAILPRGTFAFFLEGETLQRDAEIFRKSSETRVSMSVDYVDQ